MQSGVSLQRVPYTHEMVQGLSPVPPKAHAHFDSLDLRPGLGIMEIKPWGQGMIGTEMSPESFSVNLVASFPLE